MRHEGQKLSNFVLVKAKRLCIEYDERNNLVIDFAIIC